MVSLVEVALQEFLSDPFGVGSVAVDSGDHGDPGAFLLRSRRRYAGHGCRGGYRREGFAPGYKREIAHG
ncbi:hypothetical protein ACFL1R_10160 [Candidatus Latescibacterota bacterium]